MSDKKSIIDSTPVKWILAIVAVVSLSWAIIQTFRVKNPKIQYEIISQARMFNKTDDLSSVKLLVDTVDVLSGKQNISFYVIKIQNIGNQHLRWDDYDEGRFGISVMNGRVFHDVDLLEASSSHIEERYYESILCSLDNFIDIPNISLDRNEWYSISFSIIHDEDVLPTFSTVGKIVGQKQIVITTSSNDDDHLSFPEAIFDGGIWLNIARFFVFLMISIIVILIIGYSISGVSDAIEHKRQQNILTAIIQDHSILGVVRDDYISNRSRNVLLAAHYYAHGEILLSGFYKKLVRYLSDLDNIDTEDYDRYKSFYNDINRLIKLGYLQIKEDGTLIIPKEVRDSVTKIQELLKQYKVFYRQYEPISAIGSDLDDINVESGKTSDT